MDRRLLVLAIGMFALGTDSYVVAGVLPEITRAFDVSIGAAGQMTTVYSVAFALLSPIIAAIAAAIPRKRLLLSGVAIFVLANLATAMAPSFGIALLARAFAGLGAAMFSPTATGSAAMLVPAERRGFALSVVVAGLTLSTALGSPTGAVIGGLGDWRWTMAFVAALGTVAGLGVWVFLTDVPLPPAVSLSKRLAPLADVRVGLTLATTFLGLTGIFTVYTYFAVAFDQAIDGSAVVLGALLVLWGAAGTFANLGSGRLIDRIGSRKVILTMLTVLAIDSALMPWTSRELWTAVPAIAIWGAAGWGLLVPQQHRLVGLAPSIAPVLLGLNTAGSFFGISAAGVVGAVGIQVLGAHNLGIIGAGLAVIALIVAEFATTRIATANLSRSIELSPST
ncbi:MFS transporter [Bradyrhizobium sp. GCM10027634]|uniref:MFS transporter n=1 Tax=unclassified Bradyrhizobium TaxID=2631580 RepID=UPI001889E7B6|nr:MULTISPECIES: MFS transporter [unclassified Bradyrhizobium]MDN5005640.1 MFS transporter [Bradyrhizobium sp. WYCCWR 12677]QOZ48706.1 MFS transporter [Bradyrhizobium sp. CCBAU 53340]